VLLLTVCDLTCVGTDKAVEWQQLMRCVVEASKLAVGAPPDWIPWDSASVDLVDSYLCRVQVQRTAGPVGFAQGTSIQLFDTLCLDVVKAVLVKRLQSDWM
jgi:hypothetical protein